MNIFQICLALAFFVLAVAASPGSAATAGARGKNDRGKVLSETTFTANGTRHELQLWRTATPSPPPLSIQVLVEAGAAVRSGRHFPPASPSEPMFGSSVYVLTDSVMAAHPQPKRRLPGVRVGMKPRVLLVGYGVEYAFGGGYISYPPPIYSAGFTPDPGTNDVYVVMTKSIMMHAQFFVFKASLKKSLGPFPFVFTAKNVNHWPKSPPAIAEHKETLKGGFCGIALIHVFLKGASLLIYGRREDPKCPAVYIKYEINKRTWQDITSKNEIAVINKLVEIAHKRNHALRGK